MKRNLLLLISSIIATLCLAVLAFVVGKTGSTQVTISIVLSAVATALSWVGWITNKKVFPLISAIIYVAAIAIMPSIGIIALNIVQMILCFVAYGTWKK